MFQVSSGLTKILFDRELVPKHGVVHQRMNGILVFFCVPVGAANGFLLYYKIVGVCYKINEDHICSLCLPQSLETVKRLCPKKTLLIGMNHEFDHHKDESLMEWFRRGPDGYSLFACSLDGSVATFHFEVKELGPRLGDADLDELKRSRYGDVKGRKVNLAESLAQLLLEAASAKQTFSKKVVPDVQQNQTMAKACVIEGVATKNVEPQVDDGKKSGSPIGEL